MYTSIRTHRSCILHMGCCARAALLRRRSSPRASAQSPPPRTLRGAYLIVSCVAGLRCCFACLPDTAITASAWLVLITSEKHCALGPARASASRGVCSRAQQQQAARSQHCRRLPASRMASRSEAHEGHHVPAVPAPPDSSKKPAPTTTIHPRRARAWLQWRQ